MKFIDGLLNRVTMYRLVVYVLIGYVSLGLIFALMGKVIFSATELLLSVVLVLSTAYAVDRGLGRLFHIPTNSESWLITGLIIVLIVQPPSDGSEVLALLLAGALSSASKFLLTWRAKHIFNPAALAAAFVSLMTLQATTWWIGNGAFWPFTLIIGLAVLRKIRRFSLALTFTVVAVLVQSIVLLAQHHPVVSGLKNALISSPLLFLGTIMLTEPATMPPRRSEQMVFGALVAVLYVTGWRLGALHMYPEVTLLIGNIYAFAVSPKLRVRLQLQAIEQVSERVYNYVFQPDQQFAFRPGQYMEWTLPGVPYDSRGNRRTFTIASSPTENTVLLGLKYYTPSSAYKAAFSRLEVGDSIFASQLAGNFTPDLQQNAKLAFIAGGIGITPFRSMIKYVVDQNLQRDIVLLYMVSDPAELAYKSVFREAKSYGVKVVPLSARLTEAQLTEMIPDYLDRTFYISGPNEMVDSTETGLRNLKVPISKIKTDHFAGY